MMAPPPWSFGVQTLKPVSSRSPSLGQRHLEGLHISLKAQGTPPSTPTLQTLGPETSPVFLMRSLARTRYGGLLPVFGTVAGGPPTTISQIVAARMDDQQISRAKLSHVGSFLNLGRAIFGLL